MSSKKNVTRRQRAGAATAHFNYTSAQSHEDMVNGRKEAHMKIVEIKNGEGVKRVINIDPSGKKKAHTVKLNRKEIAAIRRKIFIPNLFAPLMKAVGLAAAPNAAPASAPAEGVSARNVRRHKKAHRK